MARYTGPACRLCRRAGQKLFLKGDRCYTPKCAVDRRGRPPGSQTMRQRRVSERGLQLAEKQKARHTYGVLEKQFRRYFAMAERRPGVTGEVLLQILETRLDNVAYRLGFADSRRQARQLVRHGHLTVNGRKTDIPSALLKPGDTVAWADGSTRKENYRAVARSIQGRSIPGWLSLDMRTLTGRVLSVPERSDIDTQVEEQVIVEYYSR